MGVMVRIPGPLRKITQGVEKLEVEGATLGDCIGVLEAQFPGIKERLLDEDGQMRYFVNVYLNGEDVRFLKGLDTPTKAGDELSIVPAVAGGR